MGCRGSRRGIAAAQPCIRLGCKRSKGLCIFWREWEPEADASRFLWALCGQENEAEVPEESGRLRSIPCLHCDADAGECVLVVEAFDPLAGRPPRLPIGAQAESHRAQCSCSSPRSLSERGGSENEVSLLAELRESLNGGED